MNTQLDAQEAIEALQRRRFQNRIAQRNHRKRQAELKEKQKRDEQIASQEKQDGEARVSVEGAYHGSGTKDLHNSIQIQSAQHQPRAFTEPKLTWRPDNLAHATSYPALDTINIYGDMEEALPSMILASGLDSQRKSIISVPSPSSLARGSTTPEEGSIRLQGSKIEQDAQNCIGQIPPVNGTASLHSLKGMPLTPSWSPVSLPSAIPVFGGSGILPSEYTCHQNLGKTALHIGAERGNVGIVQFLLLSGADVNGTDNCGRTALHYAAQTGHLHIVSQLLAGGADLEARDHEGRSPLHFAADAGCEAVIRFLAHEGANLNAAIGISGEISSEGEEEDDDNDFHQMMKS